MKYILCVTIFALTTPAAISSEYVWVEAESGTDKVEHSNDWYDPVDRKTSLSANDWWHSFDEPWMDSGYVVCPFGIPSAGKYRLWIRLNLSSTGYRYAIDDAEPAELPVKPWRDDDREHRETIEHERRVFDETYVSHDASNRHKLAWIKGPEVELTLGDHRIRIEVKPGGDKKGFAAVDCFVLAADGFKFRPRMFYKPEQRVQTAPELDPAGAWAFPEARDTFEPSPIDLRHLNESVAGEHGFVRLSDDGDHLVRGDGQPIRFWSGSDYAWRIPFSHKNLLVSPTERESVAHHARWAAKRGINMVRFHGHLPPKRHRDSPPVSRKDINEIDLHGAWYMVAAFKKEGIYSTLSPYWGSHTAPERGFAPLLHGVTNQGEAARTACEDVRRLPEGEIWFAGNRVPALSELRRRLGHARRGQRGEWDGGPDANVVLLHRRQGPSRSLG